MITGEIDCAVVIRLIDSVRISMRLTMDKDQFITDTSLQTSFLNKISAFLNIPTDRLRIVGIKGSSRRMLQPATG